MGWFSRVMPTHVVQYQRSKLEKDDGPPPTTAPIDRALEGSVYQEHAEFRRRLRIAKAERGAGHVDLSTLAISGARVAKADLVEAADPRVKVFAFRTLYPAMANNASSQAELNAMANLLWDALDPEEQRRYVAEAPEVAPPSNDGSTPITDPGLHQTVTAIRGNFDTMREALAQLQGSGRIEFKRDDDSTELDTSLRSVDDWHRRRQELRQKSDGNRTTVRKGDVLGLFTPGTKVSKGEVEVQARRLFDVDVSHVSLVDRGASRIPFRIQKRDGIDLSRVFERRASWAKA